jgi:acyl carrier protein
LSRKDDLDRIAEIFEEVIDLNQTGIDEQLRLGDELDATSSEVLQIVSRVQSRFGVQFAPLEIIGIQTVGDILTLIENHRT